MDGVFGRVPPAMAEGFIDGMRQRQSQTETTPRQVAVIAVRRNAGDVEVCLIRRKEARTWGIPKGFIDPGDSPEQAALNEATEEAGLTGQILGGVIGVYNYEKRDAPLTVAVYLMDVVEERKEWREMRFRERRWFSLDEAGSLLTNHPVSAL
jgi:8-oxo-dGTP pyrophosphatase MutT (NUDIX family)